MEDKKPKKKRKSANKKYPIEELYNQYLEYCAHPERIPEEEFEGYSRAAILKRLIFRM